MSINKEIKQIIREELQNYFEPKPIDDFIPRRFRLNAPDPSWEHEELTEEEEQKREEIVRNFTQHLGDKEAFEFHKNKTYELPKGYEDRPFEVPLDDLNLSINPRNRLIYSNRHNVTAILQSTAEDLLSIVDRHGSRFRPSDLHEVCLMLNEIGFSPKEILDQQTTS